MSNKKPLIFYFLYTDWDIDQRRFLLKEVIKTTSDWADAVIIQQPVSLFLHIFTRFRRKILGFIIGKYKVRKSPEGAIIFTPKILFHHYFWPKNKLIAKLDIFIYRKQYNKFLSRYYPDNFIILWLFHNRLYQLTEHIKYNFLVYDYQDNYDYFSDGTWSEIDSELNKKLIKKSDFILCSAKVMYDRAIKLNKNCIYLTNGNDFKTLSGNDVQRELPEIDYIDKPIIGYFGNTRSWMDFNLLTEMAQKLKNVHFLFIGLSNRDVKKEFNQLLKNENVSWIPYMEQKKAVAYLKRFKAGIIPFKINKVMEGVFPNKFFEYFALGIPVITTALPELEKYSDIIGFSKNNEDFINFCKASLKGEFNMYKETYISLAKENTWEKNAIIINDLLLDKISKV